MKRVSLPKILVIAAMSLAAGKMEAQTAVSCPGFTTYTMGGWGAPPHGGNPGAYMTANFAAAFPSGVTLGCTSSGGKTVTFTSAADITAFLPCGGTPAVFTASATNPACMHNTFAGQLLAASLAVGFDLWSPSFSSSSIHLQDLVISSGPFVGKTVAWLLTEANKKIGGCTSSYSASDLSDALDHFNSAYDGGSASGNYLVCPISLTINIVANVSCHGGHNGSACGVVSGGVGYGYVYSFDGGTWSSSACSSTLAAGTHSVTVKDGIGLTATATFSLTEPPALFASSSATSIPCYGGTATVTVTASGGTPPYTGTGTFTVHAGSYSYTVTDASGCTAVTTGTLTQPTALSISSSATPIPCNGGISTVTVTASGGTSPYTGVGTFTVTAGSYSFSVHDANGCAATTTGTVSQPTALHASSSATPILCNGGTSVVTVSATGGTTPYTGVGTHTVTAGTYTYTVTDANGCPATTTITITQPTALHASSSATPILCNGGISTVTVTASGGVTAYSGIGTFTVTAGSYSFTVTDANGCTATTTGTVSQPTELKAASSATPILCNGGTSTVTVSATGGTTPYSGVGTYTVTAGTYTYTVTDGNGCTAMTTVNVTQPTALHASSSATPILCNGGVSTVTVSASGGTSPYTGVGTFTVTAGTYSYTITDAHGCTAITTVNVTQPTSLHASSSATPILCNGGVSTVTVSASGGTSPYTGVGTFTVTAGGYSFTVHDANGCTATTTGTVSQPTTLTASSSATPILCNGGVSTVTVSASGGTSPYTGVGTFTVTAGSYSFTVHDANGCTATTTGTVSQPTALHASSSATPILCNGGVSTVTVSASGGTSPYTGVGTFTVTAGSYSFTVHDANGCTATTTGTVSQPTTLTASSSATPILCNGGVSTVTVSASGGTSPYTGVGTFTVTAGSYSFTVHDANGCTATTTGTVSQPTTLHASSSATPILCNGGVSTVTVSASGGTFPYTGVGTFTVTAGSYSFTVHDANGCTATTTGTVSQPTTLTASSSATPILCNGGVSTVTVSASGGTSPYTGVGTFTVTAGSYSFTVHDANGCAATTTGTVSQPTTLTASSSATPILCNGGVSTVTVSASGGTSPYTGVGTFTVTTGSYSFTVHDANGCTATTTGTVSQPTTLTASSSATPILCNGGVSTVTVSASGGTSPYTGVGTFTVTAGSYSFTVHDANGCAATTTGTVSQPTTLTASSSATPILCNGGVSTVTVSASGGTSPYTGVGTFTVTAGSYSFTVHDANGCTATTTGTVSQPTTLTASSSATPILCNGGTSTVTVSASGGTSPYTGVGTFTVTTGTYSYTITDAHGCTATTTVNVTQPTTLTASSSATSILCNGGSAIITVSASGGATPYGGVGTFTVTAGSFSYTVTDANGCTATTTRTITQPSLLTLAHTQTCAGTGCGALASILASGGTGTDTYTWSIGSSATATTTGLCNGAVVSVTVHDANSCVATFTFTITPCACDTIAFTTWTMGAWGGGGPAHALLLASFATTFPSGLTVGSTHTIHFTSGSAVAAFLPSGGTSAVLSTNYTDPTSALGNLAGQLVAAKLTVAFYPGMGSLTFVSGSWPGGTVISAFNGLTVNAVIALADAGLGGSSTAYSLGDLQSALDAFNNSNEPGGAISGAVICESGSSKMPGKAEPGDLYHVYPNPTTGMLNVVMPASDKEAQVSIVDITGRIITSLVIAPNTTAPVEFNVSGVSAGMYFVKMNVNGDSHTVKFIKE